MTSERVRFSIIILHASSNIQHSIRQILMSIETPLFILGRSDVTSELSTAQRVVASARNTFVSASDSIIRAPELAATVSGSIAQSVTQ